MRRFVVPIILTILISIPVVAWTQTVNLTPVVASEQAEMVDGLFRLLFAVAMVIFVGVMTFFFYSLKVFQRPAGDMSDGEAFHGNYRLEVAWTVIPLVVILSLGVVGAREMIAMKQRPANALNVTVTGFQFAWQFDYPDYGITSPELVLPVNQPVDFTLEARDVIHSFWIPEFRLKTDNIPGRTNHLYITPSALGEYRVRCAELCGAGHAYMLAPVRVVEPAAFQAWVDEKVAAIEAAATAQSDQERRGAELAQQWGCTACHSTDGSALVGPTWQGLFGHEVTLADGTTVTADEAYLHEAIVNPNAQLVEGYAPNLMPATFGNTLSDEDIDALIAYIKTLQ